MMGEWRHGCQGGIDKPQEIGAYSTAQKKGPPKRKLTVASPRRLSSAVHNQPSTPHPQFRGCDIPPAPPAHRPLRERLDEARNTVGGLRVEYESAFTSLRKAEAEWTKSYNGLFRLRIARETFKVVARQLREAEFAAQELTDVWVAGIDDESAWAERSINVEAFAEDALAAHDDAVHAGQFGEPL